MAWEGLSDGELCRALNDPKTKPRGPKLVVKHLTSDPLVQWAWNPGSRARPRYPSATSTRP